MSIEMKTHFLKLLPGTIDQLKDVRKKYKPVLSLGLIDHEIITLGIIEFEKKNSAKLKELMPKAPEKKKEGK